jgi:hypothetical protein
MEDQPIEPLRTAYRSVSALARTCRALHPIATDSEVVNRRAIWFFNRPIAAFTPQAALDKIWHIDIYGRLQEDPNISVSGKS